MTHAGQIRRWALCCAAALLISGLAATMAAAQAPADTAAPSAAPSTSETSSATAGDSGEGRIVQAKTLLHILRDGGPLMVPIGLCSIVLMVFVFERGMSLRRSRIIPRPFVNRFLEQLQEEQLDADAAMTLCTENRSPVAEVFAAAIQKWDRPSVEIEQAIIDAGERVANSLRRYLRLINGIATVSPLLGLLGTVLGMIQAFDALASADSASRPETLIAGGISEALLTTAAGLSVAIPALIAYLWFVGRVDRLVMELDALGQKLVSLIACDAWRPTTAGAKAGEGRSRSTKRKAA